MNTRVVRMKKKQDPATTTPAAVNVCMLQVPLRQGGGRTRCPVEYAGRICEYMGYVERKHREREGQQERGATAVDLFVLPELCPVGYCEDTFERYLPVTRENIRIHSRIDDVMKDCASKLRSYVCYGTVGRRCAGGNGEDDEDEDLFIRQVVLDRNGDVVTTYDKLYLCDYGDCSETRHFVSPLRRGRSTETAAATTTMKTTNSWTSSQKPPLSSFTVRPIRREEGGASATTASTTKTTTTAIATTKAKGRDTTTNVPDASDDDNDGIRFGIILCSDMRYPEICRSYVRHHDVDVVLQPCAFSRDLSFHTWESFAVTRAVENSVYYVGVNYSGSNYGNSIFVPPWVDQHHQPVVLNPIATTIDDDKDDDDKGKEQTRKVRDDGDGDGGEEIKEGVFPDYQHYIGRIDRNVLDQVRRSMPFHRNAVSSVTAQTLLLSS